MCTISPKYGKTYHKTKDKIVSPESYLLYHFCGSLFHPKSGTENNSPVIQFLIFILLVAAVNMPFSIDGGTENDSLNPPKVVQITALRHIDIYVVGSITWLHFGHFKVNNLATSRSIPWPLFFEPIEICFFFENFCAQFSGGGAKLVFLKVVFGQKGFPNKNVHFLGGV